MTEKTRVYTVLGFKSRSLGGNPELRDMGSLIFLELGTTNPRETAEQAISYCCEDISIHLTGGEHHHETVVSLIKSLIDYRRESWLARAEKVPVGDSAIWTVTGSANYFDPKTRKPTYKRVFSKENSVAPGEDIERALALGATRIGLEVKQWKTGTNWPNPHKPTKEEFFAGMPSH